LIGLHAFEGERSVQFSEGRYEMAISRELKYASIDELYLDPMNPRLGRHIAGRDVSQEEILELYSTRA